MLSQGASSLKLSVFKVVFLIDINDTEQKVKQQKKCDTDVIPLLSRWEQTDT